MAGGVSLLESDHLGVVELVEKVGAFAEDVAVADEDAADLRIGRGESGCGLREEEGAAHVCFVEFVWMLHACLCPLFVNCVKCSKLES